MTTTFGRGILCPGSGPRRREFRRGGTRQQVPAIWARDRGAFGTVMTILLLGAGIGILLLLLLGAVFLMVAAARAAGRPGEEDPAAPPRDHRPVARPGIHGGVRRGAVARTHALAKRNPEQTVTVLRTWLGESREAQGKSDSRASLNRKNRGL